MVLAMDGRNYPNPLRKLNFDKSRSVFAVINQPCLFRNVRVLSAVHARTRTRPRLYHLSKMLLHPKIRHYLKNWDCSHNVSRSFHKIQIVCQDHLLIVHGWAQVYMDAVSLSVVVRWGLSSNDNKRFKLVLSLIAYLWSSRSWNISHVSCLIKFCYFATKCASSDWRSFKM